MNSHSFSGIHERIWQMWKEFQHLEYSVILTRRWWLLPGEIVYIELEFMKDLILNPNKFPNVKLFSGDYQQTQRLLNMSSFSEIKYWFYESEIFLVIFFLWSIFKLLYCGLFHNFGGFTSIKIFLCPVSVTGSAVQLESGSNYKWGECF